MTTESSAPRRFARFNRTRLELIVRRLAEISNRRRRTLLDCMLCMAMLGCSPSATDSRVAPQVQSEPSAVQQAIGHDATPVPLENEAQPDVGNKPIPEELERQLEALWAAIELRESAGEFDEALQQIDQRVSLLSKHYGVNHWRTVTATVERSRVAAYCKLDENQRAEIRAMRQLLNDARRGRAKFEAISKMIPDIRSAAMTASQLLGTESYDYGTAQFFLAHALCESGELKEGMEAQKIATDISRTLYGPAHPVCLRNVVEYCGCLIENGDLRGAEKRLTQVRGMLIDDGSTDTEILMYALEVYWSDLALYRFDYEQCIERLDEILRRIDRRPGNSGRYDHLYRVTLGALERLALVHSRASPDEAADTALRSLQAADDELEFEGKLEHSRLLMAIYRYRAEQCRRNGLLDVGEEFMNLWGDQMAKFDGEIYSERINYQQQLARMRASSLQIEEAEVAYKRSLEMLAKAAPKNTRMVADLMEYAAFLRANGRGSESAEFEERADNLAKQLELVRRPRFVDPNYR